MISSEDVQGNSLSDFEGWIDQRIFDEYIIDEIQSKTMVMVFDPIRIDLQEAFTSSILDYLPQALGAGEYSSPPPYFNVSAWAKITSSFCEDQRDFYQRFIEKLKQAAKNSKQAFAKDASENYQWYFYNETDKIANVFYDTYKIFDRFWGYDVENYKHAMSIISDIDETSRAMIDRLERFFTEVLPEEIKQNRRYFFQIVFGESDFEEPMWKKAT